MKNHIRYLCVLSALLLYSSGAWALGAVTVITQVDGVATSDGGQVTAEVVEGICMLTADAAPGYFITAEGIKVVKLVTGGQAQARRRAPALAEPITLGTIDVSDPSGTTTYSFVMPDEAAYDVEVTADFHPCGLVVDRVPVTTANRLDVLGDGGSVQFDGTSILFLRNANLSHGIKSSCQHLTIVLEGNNNINTTGTAILSLVFDADLTLTRVGATSGRLTLKNTQEETGKLIVNFSTPVLENKLTLLEGDINGIYAAIGIPVNPFVGGNQKENNFSMENGANEQLHNTSINNVLFTLGDSEYTRQDDYIILQSTMIEDDVDGIIENYTPGTDAFANNFSGLTFMLPAGSGKITLDVRTGAKGVLCVKIGNHEPYTIQNILDFTEVVIPYACTEDSYVHIYNASSVAGQPARFRAGKKTSIGVGIHSLSARADEVQSSSIAANVQAGKVELSSTDIVYHEGISAAAGVAAKSPYVTVSMPAANSLTDGLFSAFGYVSFIDLRQTSLAGIKVSRKEGPFKDVSKNTFIFLPPGNSAANDEPNVVVGTICDKAVLSADMPADESFALAGGFTAQKVVLDRRFEKDQTTTLYLPFDVDGPTAAQLGTFYVFDCIENGSVKVLSAAEGVKAHTPCLFKSAADDTQIAMRMVTVRAPELPSAVRSLAAAAEEDGLYGVYGHYIAADTDVYRFEPGGTEGEMSFVRMQAGESVAPFQAYLRAASQEQGVLPVTDKEGVLTGIETLDNLTISPFDHSVYDLQGRRMDSSLFTLHSSLKKGLYIYGGRKMVVR